eukprot:8346444-Pyramimonas_sp.AAC.1
MTYAWSSCPRLARRLQQTPELRSLTRSRPLRSRTASGIFLLAATGSPSPRARVGGWARPACSSGTAVGDTWAHHRKLFRWADALRLELARGGCYRPSLDRSAWAGSLSRASCPSCLGSSRGGSWAGSQRPRCS